MRNRLAEIKNRVKLQNQKSKEIYTSNAYLRTIGVLSGLGFLIAPDIKPLPTSKVEFDDAFTIGTTIEPRVLEVLPAAVLSFPKSFLHLEKAPPIFKEILRALKRGEDGPDFCGIKFSKFLEAANREVKNKKRKPLKDRKVPKTYRLSPAIIEIILDRSSKLGIDQTTYIENLVREAAERNPKIS